VVDRNISKSVLIAILLMASTVPVPLLLAEAPAEPVYNPVTDLVARRTATAPSIDGIIDSAWDDALVLGTFATGNSGNFDINLRAMFDNDYIYILAEWREFNPPDPARQDSERDAWELTSNVTPGTWDHKDWGVDRLSFFFEDPDEPVENFTTQGCDAICHDLKEMHTKNPGEKLDAWVWSSATTNEQSYADDGVLLNNNTVTIDPKRMHVTVSDMDWDSGGDGWWNNNDTANATERPTHVWKAGASPADPRFMWMSDADDVDWSTFDITTLPQGEMIPGHVLMTPSGDRANVEAKGVHDGNNWTVEFKRLRDTGSSDDVAFDETNVPYYFSPAVTNNMTGEDHAKGITSYKIWLAEPEMPDLKVSVINPIGTSFSVNTTIKVGVFVENIGWADSGASKLSWYWDEAGAPGPVLVDTTAVAWGKTQYVEFNASAQDLTPGNNSLVVEVDAEDVVSEINDTNNVFTEVIFLEEEPLPNLRVSDMSIDPVDLTPDGYGQVSVSIASDGVIPAPSAEIILYLDDIGNPITTDTLPVIDDGNTHVWSYTWGPVMLPLGDHVLNVSVDPNALIKETSETDNSMSLDFSVIAPTLPDLVIEDVTAINSSVTQGEETRTRVVVGNAGGATIVDDFQVALFLNEAFTVGTIGLVGTADVTDDIPAGGNASVVVIWTVPVGTDVGANHFLRAEVDWMKAIEELDEGNNNGTFNGLTVFPRPLPDLTVSGVVPTDPTVKMGDRVTFTITVSNVGTKATPANTTLLIKDLNHNVSIDSIPVLEIDVDGNIQLQYEWFVDVSSPGPITLQFLIDPLNHIEEDDEFNNGLDNPVTVEEADLPDLSVTPEDITFFPEVPRVGEAVTISVTVRNIGTIGTEETTTLGVWLGNNRILQTDLLALGAGESRTLDMIWPTNEIMTPLEYSLTFRVDPDNKIKEGDVSNNDVENKKITFVDPPSSRLDNLVVTVSNGKVKDGSTVTITVSIDNAGNAADLITIVVKDGVVEVASKQAVTVPAGGDKTETFDIKMEGTGDHNLEVTIFHGSVVATDPSGNDLVDSVTVDVTEKDGNGGGNSMMIIVIIVVILVIVGLAAYFLMGRK
jgi:subtilase family serine protease